MNRQELAEEMHGLGDSYDDGRIDMASVFVYRFINMVEKDLPPTEIVDKLTERLDAEIADLNFAEEEDRLWDEEHGL